MRCTAAELVQSLGDAMIAGDSGPLDNCDDGQDGGRKTVRPGGCNAEGLIKSKEHH